MVGTPPRLHSRPVRRTFEGHASHVLGVGWKADGSEIATAGADNVIKLWNAATGDQIRTIAGHGKQVTDVDYVGVLPVIVACGGDRQVRTYNSDNGTPRRPFAGNTDFVYAVVAAADESLVAAAGEDGMVRIWNGANGQPLFTFDPSAPVATAMTRHGAATGRERPIPASAATIKPLPAGRGSD